MSANKPRVTVVCDTPDSFVIEYIPLLKDKITNKISVFDFIQSLENEISCDILILISCRTILKKEFLERHPLIIVIHPSKLPKGRGSAASTWEILNGNNELWVTLFEPDENIDNGPIIKQRSVLLDGTELCDEIRRIQAMLSFDLIAEMLDEYPDVSRTKQVGEKSYYKRRSPADSKLDVDRTIAEQFELLRVCDNKRYPAFFEYRGRIYTVKIYPESVINMHTLAKY